MFPTYDDGMSDQGGLPVAESDFMDRVNVTPNGPSEPDEMDVLTRLLPYDPETGTFSVHVGDDD